MSGMFWIALEVSIPKKGLNIMLPLTVKRLDAFKFDGVAESDNTARNGVVIRQGFFFRDFELFADVHILYFPVNVRVRAFVRGVQAKGGKFKNAAAPSSITREIYMVPSAQRERSFHKSNLFFKTVLPGDCLYCARDQAFVVLFLSPNSFFTLSCSHFRLHMPFLVVLFLTCTTCVNVLTPHPESITTLSCPLAIISQSAALCPYPAKASFDSHVALSTVHTI